MKKVILTLGIIALALIALVGGCTLMGSIASMGSRYTVVEAEKVDMKNDWKSQILNVDPFADETGVVYDVIISNDVNWDSRYFAEQGRFAQNVVEYCTKQATADYGFNHTAVTAWDEDGNILFIGGTGGSIKLWVGNRPKDSWSWM